VSEGAIAMADEMMGGFDTIEELRAAGFEGFATVSDLIGSRCAEVPVARGVYVVVRESAEAPRFLPKSVGGHYRRKDPTEAVADLEAKWVPGAIILYFGRAAGPGVRSLLQQRVKRYIRFGGGRVVSHWGGRYVWQLTDHRSLRFAWKPCDDPIAEEARLLSTFERCHGALPFANLRHEHEREES
jgi:hypothetical protein